MHLYERIEDVRFSVYYGTAWSGIRRDLPRHVRNLGFHQRPEVEADRQSDLLRCRLHWWMRDALFGHRVLRKGHDLLQYRKRDRRHRRSAHSERHTLRRNTTGAQSEALTAVMLLSPENTEPRLEASHHSLPRGATLRRGFFFIKLPPLQVPSNIARGEQGIPYLVQSKSLRTLFVAYVYFMLQ